MPELCVERGKIQFAPGVGWDWQGWQGKVSAEAPDRGFQCAGRTVTLAEDIVALGRQLIGRSYTATGFADVPGSVVSAVVRCTDNTLSAQTSLDGKRAVTCETRGTFTLTCRPALKAGSPPIPDPVVVKQGTWSVVETGQDLVRSE